MTRLGRLLIRGFYGVLNAAYREPEIPDVDVPHEVAGYEREHHTPRWTVWMRARSWSREREGDRAPYAVSVTLHDGILSTRWSVHTHRHKPVEGLGFEYSPANEQSRHDSRRDAVAAAVEVMTDAAPPPRIATGDLKTRAGRAYKRERPYVCERDECRRIHWNEWATIDPADYPETIRHECYECGEQVEFERIPDAMQVPDAAVALDEDGIPIVRLDWEARQ